jgi:hypothetical protein
MTKYKYHIKVFLELAEQVDNDEVRLELLLLADRNLQAAMAQLQASIELNQMDQPRSNLMPPESYKEEELPEKRKKAGTSSNRMKEIWASRTPEEVAAIRAKMKAAIRKTYARRRQVQSKKEV